MPDSSALSSSARRKREVMFVPQAEQGPVCHFAVDDAALIRFLRDNCEALAPVISSITELRRPVNRSLGEAVARLLVVTDEPIQAAFVSRASNAIARMVSVLSPSTLGEAVGESSDYEVLLDALEAQEVVTALQADDPLAAARLRGIQARNELLTAEGGVLGVGEVAELLGITRQAVDKRRRNGTLLGLAKGQSKYAYPAWQFAGHRVLPGFEEVLACFKVEDPWTRAGFFLSGNALLNGQRPLDVLRQGHIDQVCRAAGAFGEHASW
ncbi:MAG TPA: hypothetical protein VHS06_04945 [Chloroflexota bacterium]|nr:hypothetical protein [Chloroflexota bacterium]